MAKKHFTENQVRELVHNNEVHSVEHEDGRWSKSVTTIVEDTDGKLYKMFWEKGLTEYQDNEYYADNYEEVFKVVTNVGTTRTNYLTEQQLKTAQENKAKGFNEEVSALKVIADVHDILNESKSIDMKILNSMISTLKRIELLNVNNSMVVDNSIAVNYLESLKEVKELIEKD